MRFPLAALLALTPLVAHAAEPVVSLQQTDGAIEITIGNQPFAAYRYQGFKKPFLADLRAPDGTVITRSLDAEAVTDHPHHKGLWISVDEVDEHKHWKEDQRILAHRVNVVAKQDGDPSEPAEFRVVNHWLGNGGVPLLKESTTFRIFPDRLVAADIRLTPAGAEPVEFADTKEGFFAIRVRDELREKGGTGKIVNANGQKGEAEAWGQAAPWVDYSGTVDGKPVGVAIFDHPDNFRPSRYHVRAYGLFAVSPFGESAYTNGKNEAKPVHLKPGETLRLRYAAFLHAGDAESADVAARFKKYVADSK
ncbi:MAG: PmoA family protein [Planctomycetaceae bacterium]